jgi:hypothetical protein
VQDSVAGAALQDFTKVAVRSIESGTFSTRDESWFTWDPLTYDELALKAAVNILAGTPGDETKRPAKPVEAFALCPRTPVRFRPSSIDWPHHRPGIHISGSEVLR